MQQVPAKDAVDESRYGFFRLRCSKHPYHQEATAMSNRHRLFSRVQNHAHAYPRRQDSTGSRLKTLCAFIPPDERVSEANPSSCLIISMFVN